MQIMMHTDDDRITPDTSLELVKARLDNISWDWIVIEKENVVWLRIDKKKDAKYKLEYCFRDKPHKWTYPPVDYDKTLQIVTKFMQEDPVWQNDKVWYDEEKQKAEGRELMFYSSVALTGIALFGNLFHSFTSSVCKYFNLETKTLLGQISFFGFLFGIRSSFGKIFDDKVEGWISLSYVLYIGFAFMIFVFSVCGK